jgi:hypothetical protein
LALVLLEQFAQAQGRAGMNLPASMEAKEGSPTYADFVQTYGTTDAHELEAVEPGDLQTILRKAIEGVMDMNAYRAEVAKEAEDIVQIKAMKAAFVKFAATIEY